jgi:hypothetical protein
MNISQVAYVRKNKPSKSLLDKRWVKKALSHKREERKCKAASFKNVLMSWGLLNPPYPIQQCEACSLTPDELAQG